MNYDGFVFAFYSLDEELVPSSPDLSSSSRHLFLSGQGWLLIKTLMNRLEEKLRMLQISNYSRRFLAALFLSGREDGVR